MLKYFIATGKAETNILTQYGVNVSGSTGLLGRPDFKNAEKFDWKYLHGEWIDLRNRRYKSREIKLKCWVKANSEQSAINRMNNFMKAFDTNQIIRLHIEFVNNNSGAVISGAKGLFYLVYLSKTGQPSYRWNPSRQVISFEVTLTEPSPVKRVIEVGGTDSGTVTLNYTSSSEFDIHWGDGDVTYDCIGTDTASHAYTTSGKHYLILTGVIGDISALTWQTSTNELTLTQIYDEI